jgi:hAT family C-terminal dimerisation region
MSDEDWSDLSKLADILMPFEKVMLATQGNNQGQGSVISVLLSMDMLLNRLEKLKEESMGISTAFQLLIDSAWGKLDKYYSLTERSPIYVVSIILHPCLKMKYFQRHWREHPHWIESAYVRMREYYGRYQHTSNPLEPAAATQSELDEWCFGESLSEQPESELEQYLNTPVITLRSEESLNSFDVIAWYKGNESQFPTLSSIAFDLYAVPAMSAEAERVFSRYIPISIKN